MTARVERLPGMGSSTSGGPGGELWYAAQGHGSAYTLSTQVYLLCMGQEFY